jgi:hypothetical protein
MTNFRMALLDLLRQQPKPIPKNCGGGVTEAIGAAAVRADGQAGLRSWSGHGWRRSG